MEHLNFLMLLFLVAFFFVILMFFMLMLVAQQLTYSQICSIDSLKYHAAGIFFSFSGGW